MTRTALTLAALLTASTAQAQAQPQPQPQPEPNPSEPAQTPQTAGAGGSGGTGAAGQGSITITGQALPPPPTPKDTPKEPSLASPTDALVTGTAGARAAGAPPPGTGLGNFVDTRLTWTFGDDDFLNRTGVLVPLSPSFTIGDRPQYRLFFDNLNSRFAGRENLTHLVLYKKMPGFITGLTTEAAVVLRFDLASLAANTGNINSALYDSGSYIRIFYRTHDVTDAKTGKAREAGVSAVFFPLDTDRMRLGYLYDISWGGTDPRINESIFPRIQGSSPGFKIQYDMPDRFYAFAGFKTATIIQPVQVLNPGSESEVEVVRVGEANYGGLVGGGVDVHPMVRFDVGGGMFQQGKFDLEDVRGKSVYTYGASGRMVVHKDMPVPQSVDFRLYRNDPQAPMVLFAPTRYDPNELAWSVSAEGSYLRQHLKDFNATGATRDQSAFAAALQGVLALGYARVSLTGIARDLNYVVRNVPGFIPFETLPTGAKTDLELFGAAAFSYYFETPRLTPEIGVGLQLPATFKSTFTEGGVQASRTIVVRRQGDESILPFGEGRRPILQARVSLKWTLSDVLSMVLWGQLVNDENGTLIVRDPAEGTASLRIFQKSVRLGAGLALQARF